MGWFGERNRWKPLNDLSKTKYRQLIGDLNFCSCREQRLAKAQSGPKSGLGWSHSSRSTSRGRWLRIRALTSHPPTFASKTVAITPTARAHQSNSNGASMNLSEMTRANRFAKIAPTKPATPPKRENSIEKTVRMYRFVEPNVLRIATSRIRR